MVSCHGIRKEVICLNITNYLWISEKGLEKLVEN